MSRPEAGDREGKLVLCPLFKAYGGKHGQSWIKCESHMPDSYMTIHQFKNQELCKQQQEIFCKGCYKNCEHYRAWKHFKWPEDE